MRIIANVLVRSCIHTPQYHVTIKKKGVLMLYKIKAKIKPETLKDFFTILTDGSVEVQKPDGDYILKAMKESVMVDSMHIAWYEACYCATPLKHERETVYDKYLTDFETKMVYEVSDDLVGESFWSFMQEHYNDEAYSY